MSNFVIIVAYIEILNPNKLINFKNLVNDFISILEKTVRNRQVCQSHATILGALKIILSWKDQVDVSIIVSFGDFINRSTCNQVFKVPRSTCLVIVSIRYGYLEIK